MHVVHAYSILLTSSIDISLLPHVLEVLQAGDAARYSPRYTSSAVLYASELLIFRRAVGGGGGGGVVVVDVVDVVVVVVVVIVVVVVVVFIVIAIACACGVFTIMTP
jgi:hypothetical protein